MTDKTKCRRTRAQWQQLVQAQPGSGLSIQGYCANQHVSVSSFYLWRNKLGGATDASDKPDNWLPLSLAAYAWGS